MINRIGTVKPCGSNKGFSLRFCVDFQVQNETPDEMKASGHISRNVECITIKLATVAENDHKALFQ